MHNQIPTLIGTMTVFGTVIHNEQIFICTMIIIAAASIIAAAQIVRQEILRCRRIKMIGIRRSARNG